jgi:hypothetical protein
MSKASHLEGEAIEDTTVTKTERQPIQKRPPAVRSAYQVACWTFLPLNFYSKTKNAIAMSIRVEKQLCSLIANDHAGSAPCARMTKRRKTTPPSLFYVYRPRYAKFSSFHAARSMPKDLFVVATILTPRSDERQR